MTDQLPKEHIDVLLAAAVAAPSMHNTQPWRFEIDGHVIDVYLDGSRTLPAEDPTGRAMRIAAGAATFNLRCAAESLGYGTWFGLAPYPKEEPDLLARIVIEPSATRNDELRDLAVQIPYRHTDRNPSDTTPVAEGTRISLMQAACAEGAQLTWLADDDVHKVLDLVLDTDLREIGDWHRRAERAHWVGGERTAEGIPSSALGPRSATYPAAVRDMGTRPTDRVRVERQFEQHPDLAVLSTGLDEPSDQVAAGAALERVLLTATRDGVSASFLNQPLEYDDLRRRVQRLTGLPGHAHMIIRFGHHRSGSATARRPLAEFLKEQS
ncbi:nitroreductase family protein [Kribbella sp. VKM Ac-2571]|uniref:Acg family FMN-binding oxidoreductase n=1 Tax=Kribbella sp. VKM Ac-2571 TaxID=2512222 RepID=UPI00105F279E|nr:nitroreductase family protein [Kribbella sp. VKM Ac-2571]TDO51128.1 nitroreductase family protein [Kribbella sp. VKM Ac-2571]